MTHLPDVNYWLALAFESHVHHASARAWFDGLSLLDRCAFCRMTQLGFLRLATNPKAFDEEAVTLIGAWRLYDSFISDQRIYFAEEQVGMEVIWRDYTSRQTLSPKVWNDAYLAAFARQAGIELVTFDQGYTQYANLKCKLLS